MHANLEVVTQLLPGLWKLLGKRYEVILHAIQRFGFFVVRFILP